MRQEKTGPSSPSRGKTLCHGIPLARKVPRGPPQTRSSPPKLEPTPDGGGVKGRERSRKTRETAIPRLIILRERGERGEGRGQEQAPGAGKRHRKARQALPRLAGQRREGTGRLHHDTLEEKTRPAKHGGPEDPEGEATRPKGIPQHHRGGKARTGRQEGGPRRPG